MQDEIPRLLPDSLNEIHRKMQEDIQRKIEENEKKWDNRFSVMQDVFTHKITDQDKTISDQNKTISNLQSTLTAKMIEIANKDEEILILKNVSSQAIFVNASQSTEKRETQTPYQSEGDASDNEYEMTSIPLKNKEIPADLKPVQETKFNKRMLSPPRNTSVGIQDTFFYFFNCREIPRDEDRLKYAAYHGNIEYLTSLLEYNNIDINGRGMPDSICAMADKTVDKTALILAAQQGHVSCVIELLKRGANVNYLDRDNRTAIDYAAQNEHQDIVKILWGHSALTGKEVSLMIGVNVTNGL
jgi:hypothetical protein